MYTNAKCVYCNYSSNLSGKSILLTISQYDEKILEIIVKYGAIDHLYRKCILLFLVITLNIIFTLFQTVSTKCSTIVFLIVAFVIYKLFYTVKLERLLIVQSLSLQVQVQYLLGETTKYLAWEDVRDIFINEVVSKQRVIFILTILTKDTTKNTSTLIPLFTETMPRLQSLEVIYQFIENCHN